MKFSYLFLQNESAAVIFEQSLFLLTNNADPSDNCLSRIDSDIKIQKINDLIHHGNQFRTVKKLLKNTELTLYTLDQNNFSVLIKIEKYRFFYGTSGFFNNIGSKIDDIIMDLKQFFPRRLDLAILPLNTVKNDPVTYFLNKINPRYFAPLLPDNDPKTIENFLKNFNPGNTAVLIYTHPCEFFEFNLF